ncbi:hypothetical protein [Paenibacillus segetis]|uniref:Uncharacterized protein n=1 Tax=Paenibacillus segetis TaxID=1325360 RepID=A0ABQ1YSS9_9BACL|nr:hypothetical protein [Paenibacillus segetis]GGH35293.1 hypothetical protein GCM10008013_41530 [Paenibacillus segetis]
MELKDHVKLVDLIQKAKLCSGDVYYKSGEGDVLNLKSLLTQLLLQSIVDTDSSILAGGQIVCFNDDEAIHFSEYVKDTKK